MVRNVAVQFERLKLVEAAMLYGVNEKKNN